MWYIHIWVGHLVGIVYNCWCIDPVSYYLNAVYNFIQYLR